MFDGIAAQKIDDQLAKQSFPVLKVMNTIMKTEIMNILSRRLLSRIVAISTTIIFLSPMFASLYFYSFPSSTTTTTFPLFPPTTTTTIRNTTYLSKLLSCISLIINMKKQKRKIKNVVSPALIIHHTNTNSDIICFIAKNCSLIFIC